MRLILTTIILTLLAQPVWAEDQLDLDEIREIIAETTKEGVASALAACLEDQVYPQGNPRCACALNHRTAQTQAGFEVLYEDCIKADLERTAAEFVEWWARSEIRTAQKHVENCLRSLHQIGEVYVKFDVIVRVSPQGLILNVDLKDKPRIAPDPLSKAYAISAVRALKGCSPLPIPYILAEGYRDFRFAFSSFPLKVRMFLQR